MEEEETAALVEMELYPEGGVTPPPCPLDRGIREGTGLQGEKQEARPMTMEVEEGKWALGNNSLSLEIVQTGLSPQSFCPQPLPALRGRRLHF